MAVKNTAVGPRVAQDFRPKVTKVRVNRGHGGDSVTFAEGEQILSTTRGIADIQVQKTAVVKSDKRYRR